MPHSRKGIDLFDKIGQARPGLKLDLGQGSQAQGRACLARRGRKVSCSCTRLVEGGVFGTPPLVVDAPSSLAALISAFAGRQRPCAWLSRWRRLNRFVHRP
ncbi:MAG: hypothetical protein M3461_02120 [Pseudomonadota bacterium]|nr:hypothetical protein [Pseudomonadota bacterium]